MTLPLWFVSSSVQWRSYTVRGFVGPFAGKGLCTGPMCSWETLSPRLVGSSRLRSCPSWWCQGQPGPPTLWWPWSCLAGNEPQISNRSGQIQHCLGLLSWGSGATSIHGPSVSSVGAQVYALGVCGAACILAWALLLAPTRDPAWRSLRAPLGKLMSSCKCVGRGREGLRPASLRAEGGSHLPGQLVV